jgi:hypothetical protein
MSRPNPRSHGGRRWLWTVLVLAAGAALLVLQLPVSADRVGQDGGRWEEVWSTPLNLGPVINTAADENTPALSKDGLTLYFSSTGAGGQGKSDIWVTHRADDDGPWDPPVNVLSINSAEAESQPALSRNGHWMFFSSSRAGGQGGGDIWVSWRQFTDDDLGWETPVNLGPVVNFQYEDQGPFLLQGEDGQPSELYFSNNRRLAVGYMDIVVSRLQEDGTFGPPELVPELCTPFNEWRPQLAASGRELVFMSNRPGGLGAADIWMSHRPSRLEPWALPINPTAVNSASQDAQPTLSDDGRTLIFMSQRPGGYGGSDLWMSTRSRVKVDR